MESRAQILPGTLDLLILKAVSLGPLHGYGLLLRIGQISKGALAPEQGTFFFDTQHQLIRSILREGILPERTSSPLGVRLFTDEIQVDLIAQNGDPVGLLCLGSIVS